MDRRSKNIAVGVITSFFLTPFVGGALTGYLNGPDGREMLRSGSIVGAITGFILGCFLILFGYFMEVRPALMFDEQAAFEQLMMQHVGFASIVFLLSIVMAIFGAGLGNGLAYRYRSRRKNRTSN